MCVTHEIGFNLISLIIIIIDQEDYDSLSLNVTFTPDEFEKSIQVLIFNDTLFEDSEIFYGNLMTSHLQSESLAQVVTAAVTIEISYSDCKSSLNIWCMGFIYSLNSHNMPYICCMPYACMQKSSPGDKFASALIMGEKFVLYIKDYGDLYRVGESYFHECFLQ